MSRCSIPLCRFAAAHGVLCRAHAAAAGHEQARAELAEQGRRGRASRAAAELQRRHGGRARRTKAKPIDLSIYRHDPVGFARDVLGIELTEYQKRALLALAAHRRVTWRSCHGAGKTTVGSIACIWFVCCWSNALVITTAPTARQVRGVLWRAIRRLVAGAKIKLGEEPPGDVPELGWRPAHDRLLLGLTADRPEAFAGMHDEHVLVVVDEASGVSQSIHEAIRGSLTGDSTLLMISNPTQRSGEFYDSHNRKAALYHRLHTSAADVISEGANVPGLIDQRYVNELVADYGEASSVVAVRVHGEFPSDQSDAVFSYALVEEARARWSEAKATGQAFHDAGPLRVGVDPARYGDDLSCVVACRGNIALEPVTFAKLDGNELAARVVDIVERLRRPGETPSIRVDTIGVGASVVDRLKLIATDCELVPINVGEVATSEQYERLRDELWLRARDWVRDGGALPPDEKLVGELIAPTFGFSPRGRQKVEAKDETKKRLRRSPDRADAFCLAVYTPPNTGGGALDYAAIDLEGTLWEMRGFAPLPSRNYWIK